jgi:hypothetical protein
MTAEAERHAALPMNAYSTYSGYATARVTPLVSGTEPWNIGINTHEMF